MTENIYVSSKNSYVKHFKNIERISGGGGAIKI